MVKGDVMVSMKPKPLLSDGVDTIVANPTFQKGLKRAHTLHILLVIVLYDDGDVDCCHFDPSI